MNHKRITKTLTPISELTSLGLAAAASKRARRLSTSKRLGQPLIDMVNPQPKAFFAYLQMPKVTTKPSTKAKRVSRRKSGSK